MKVSLNEAEIKQAITQYVMQHSGASVKPHDVRVEVKSAHNYRSEWETAAIRCEFEAVAK